MDLARIIGNVVCERKDPALEGVQLCLMQPLDENLEPVASPIIATETTASRGRGDVVFYVASGDAVHTHPDGRAMPVDAAIIGLVDEVRLRSGEGRTP